MPRRLNGLAQWEERPTLALPVALRHRAPAWRAVGGVCPVNEVQRAAHLAARFARLADRRPRGYLLTGDTSERPRSERPPRRGLALRLAVLEGQLARARDGFP